MEWSVLQDFEAVLSVSTLSAVSSVFIDISLSQVPHRVQMSMAQEKTPILSGAIPAFETFMWEWEVLADKHPRLKPWIDVGLEWATEYYTRMDRTDAYIIAMCD